MVVALEPFFGLIGEKQVAAHCSPTLTSMNYLLRKMQHRDDRAFALGVRG